MSDGKFTDLQFESAGGPPSFQEWTAKALNSVPTKLSPLDEYERGLADGQQLACVAFEEERTRLTALIASSKALEPVEPHAIRCLILETVERLVSDIVGNCPVDKSRLLEQIDSVVAISREVEDHKVLWLNPDDIALLKEDAIAVEIRSDAQLVRGSIRLETESGWLEHGRLMMLDALRAELATHGGHL